MAITSTTKMANRYGLNIEIYDYNDVTNGTFPSPEDALLTVDFANVSDINLSEEGVWATGGQEHDDMIGFPPKEYGTFKISTQIMTRELLALMLDSEVVIAGNKHTIDFKGACGKPKYYAIKADTVWDDEDKITHAETLRFWKVTPKRALNLSYNGDGDPQSVDIEFTVKRDIASDKVLTIELEDGTPVQGG